MAEPGDLPTTGETLPRPIDTYRALVADRADALRRRRHAVLGSGLGLLLVAAAVIGLSVARAGGSHNPTASGAIGQPGSSSGHGRPAHSANGNSNAGPNSDNTAPVNGTTQQGGIFGTMHGCRPDVLCFVSGPGLAQFTTARPRRFTVPVGTVVVINLTDGPGAHWGVPTLSPANSTSLLPSSNSAPGRATLRASSSGKVAVTVRCSGVSCPPHPLSVRIQVVDRSGAP